TRSAIPELVQSVGNYNVVFYDGAYYGLPQSLDPVCDQLIQNQLLENGFVSYDEVALRRRLWKKFKALVRPLLVILGLRQPLPAPTSSCPIPWGDVDVSSLPGVIARNNLPQVIAEIESRLGIST